MDLAARASVKMDEEAPAGMRGGGQQPAVVCLGWWQVAAREEMTMTEAAMAMAEAAAE